MGSPADAFFAGSAALLARVRGQNAAVLAQLGGIIGQSVAGGGVIHTFGTGHSALVAKEIIGRAGGLACVSGLPDPTGGFVEDLPGYGTALAERYDRQHGLRAGETIIVVSNSGKNCAPIEVALYARQKQLHVVALTSLAMARAVATTHPGGKKLHEIADHVLDNGGEVGDALVDVGGGLRAGPTSTLTGALLLQLLCFEVIAWLQAHGHPLPVLRSQNLPGNIESNRALARRYHGRLSRPLA